MKISLEALNIWGKTISSNADAKETDKIGAKITAPKCKRKLLMLSQPQVLCGVEDLIK